MPDQTYTRPALDVIPPDLVCLADYERLAADFIDPATYAYIAGGSGDEISLRDNRQALDEITVHHRVLCDCRRGSTALTLLGQQFRHPILLAPVAFQALVHPEGELATAQAADALEAGLIASTLSSFSLEAIAGATGGPKWFQLYFQPRREDTRQLQERARAAGYSAIVATLDSPVQSVSRRSQRAAFTLPPQVRAVNLQQQAPPPQVALSADQSIVFQGMMSEAPTWADLAWLLEHTDLPVLAKGVSHPDDARRLREAGIAGIVVSNHGGRALDCVPAGIRLLPAIRQAVGEHFPLLVDGGIRSGYDVFKALAAGADAVAIGRPQMYALAVAGARGVAHTLKILRDELEVCMSLAGCPDIASIDRQAICEAHNLRPWSL